MSTQFISVTSSISLTVTNSGNVYQLNNPNANSTIALPNPTNGFNVTFVDNNSSNYSYNFSTPNGVIVEYTKNNLNSTPVLVTTNSTIILNGNVGLEYFISSDGINYFLYIVSISPSGVTPGLYGSSTQVPQITFDETGKAISASNIPIAFPSGSISVTGTDLTMSGITGTAITNATLNPTGVVAGTYGGATQIPQFTIDSKGRVTSASNNNISFPSGGNYHSTFISNSFSIGDNTTYTIGSFNVTFPSFSPSGKWKIIVQVISNMGNNNAGPGWQNYGQVITDGNNTVSGTNWVVYSTNGIGYGVDDTFIMGDYTQGSNVTFTIKIWTAGGVTPTQYNNATINYAFIY